MGAGWLVVQHLNNSGAAATAGPLVRPVAAQGPYKVRHVTDGDTIDVLIGRRSTVIRLLGIDTPETKKPNVAVQCYGPEASARTTQLLSGQSVWLETDPTQDKLDKYGRTLAYVWLDQTLVDDVLVREGYAHEYTYGKPYAYQARFLASACEHR